MRSLALVVPLLVLAGCVAQDVAPAAVEPPIPVDPDAPLLVAHTLGGAPVALPALVPELLATTLEYDGAEPTLGVTSDGTLFFVALERVLRSTDGGQSWDVVSTPLSSPATLDPYVYVDPATDRVWSDQLYLGCSWLSYSDDLGETWITNPAACGRPGNDHQKLVAAKNVGPIPQSPLYSNVLYYGYNDVLSGASRVSMSYDGGLTWPVNSETVPSEYCNGGLHGNLVADAAGNVYVPKRDCDGFVLGRSTDSGMSWSQVVVGKDVGGSECRKNPDLAVDNAGNLYGVWPGKDNHLYLSTSVDQGETWLPESLDISPAAVNMTTMPAIVAGSPGRIAAVYYGTSDGAKGPDEVSEDAIWHLYATYSLDALNATPTFVTVQVTKDPVQVGGISTNSECDAPQGSRNLLDFLDAQLTTDGRLLVAFTDGCVEKCVQSLKMKDSRAGLGAFAVLTTGPSLFEEVGALTAPFLGPAGAGGAGRASLLAPVLDA